MTERRLSEVQVAAVAKCVHVLREVPKADRLEVLVVLCKSLWEERLCYLLFPEDYDPPESRAPK